MPPLKWAAFALGTAAIFFFVVRWYRAREEPVRGRLLAAGLRATALSLFLLIVLNPTLPTAWERVGDDSVLLLDASYSMSRPASPEGRAPWSLALDSLSAGGDVWLFGGTEPYRVPVDSLPAEPVYGESRLAPAIRAVGLSGARRARVLTDGRIGDVGAATDEARRQGVALSFTTLSGAGEESGVGRVAAPRWAQAGDSAFVTIELVAAGLAGDTLRVEIVDEDDAVVARERVTMPDAERYESARLGFVAPSSSGIYRYEVRLQQVPGDPEPRDNRRPFHLRVSEDPGGAVLISLRPDWEPSFLFPNLDRLTDVPWAAYLWLGDSLVSVETYRATPLDVVARRSRAAPLLVLHGYGADAPAWARELARGAGRLLVFAAGDRGFSLPGWGVEIGPALAGEWYASPEVPRTPLALDLVGFAEADLPPLLRPRPITAGRGWEPLQLRRVRRGEPVPAVVAGSAGERRWAVATAEGYWRWAFRPGDGRQLYRTLWTGLGGWLLEDGAGSETVAGLGPLASVVERGQPLRWVVPAGLDSVAVELVVAEATGSGTVGRMAGAGGDTLAWVAAPGRYLYRAAAFSDGSTVGSTSGLAEVEEFSSDLLPRPVADLDDLAVSAGAEVSGRAAGRARRLASAGWIYVLLILLFCAEWGVRRFIGLR